MIFFFWSLILSYMLKFVSNFKTTFAFIICTPFNPFLIIRQLTQEGKNEEAALLLHSINEFFYDCLINQSLKFSEIQNLALKSKDWIIQPQSIGHYCNIFLKKMAGQSQELALKLCQCFNSANDGILDHIFNLEVKEFVITASPDVGSILRSSATKKIPELPMPVVEDSWSDFLSNNFVAISIGLVVIVSIGIGVYYWYKKPVLNEVVVDSSSSVGNIPENGKAKLYSLYESDLTFIYFYNNCIFIIIFSLIFIYIITYVYRNNYYLLFTKKRRV